MCLKFLERGIKEALAISFQPLTILAKSFVLDVWQASEYTSG